MPNEDMDQIQEPTLEALAVEPAAPVETPEPTEPSVDAAPDPDETPLTDEEHAEAEAKKRKTGSQRAREKAMRLEMENQWLKEQIAKTNQPTVQADPTPKTGEPKAPLIEEFQDWVAYQVAHAKYVEDLTDYRIQKTLAARELEAQVRSVADADQAKHNAARAEIPDLDDDLREAFAGGFRIPPQLVPLLDSSEKGYHLAHWLATHPDDHKRISALPPLAAAKELGKLEDKLASKPTPPSKPSSAPAPITPVRGGSAPTKAAYSRYEEF